MKYNYFFNYTDLAWNDLLHAAKWYEQQKTGLGIALLDTVDSIKIAINNIPLGFQTRLNTNKLALRFAPLQKFPYSIVYAIVPNKNEIIIFALWPHKKDPKKLKKRVK
jgi:hypothetical protein